VSAANHALLYCQPMSTGRSAGENNCRLTPDSSIQRTSGCSTDILHATHQTTLRTSASLPYTLGKCVVWYKEGICLIGAERTSDIMWCSWEHTFYKPVWEHSGRIALLKYWVNVLCIVGSLKYIRYKTTCALKLFKETQSWVPHCTYVAYFATGVLLRSATNETDVRKQRMW